MADLVRVSTVDTAVSCPAPPLPPAPLDVADGTRAAGWLVGAATVAAAVAVDPDGLRPFTSLRWLLVGAAVALAVVVIGRPEPTRARLPRWFVVAGAVLLGAVVVSAAFGLDRTTAWLGHPQRHLGVLAWLVFAAGAFVGTGLGHRAGDVPAGLRVIARAATAAGLLVGGTALADLLGWSPLGVEFAGGRAGGLLGQPTTMAALSVLLLPIAAVSPTPRAVRLAAVSGLCLAVVGAQTRGALLGLAVAALVSAPAWAHRSQRVRLVLGGVVLSGVVLVSPFGGRVADALESGRLDEWRVAGDVVADRPLLGAGPEGYRIAALDALDDAYVDEHGRDVVIDRAHSAPLDVAAAAGVPAGVAYVVLVAGVATSTWRLQRREPWSLPAAAGTGAVSLFATGLVSFPVPEIDAIGWVFAGVAVAAASTTAPVRILRRGARTTWIRIASAVLATVALVAGTTDVVADRHLATAVGEAAAGRHEQARAAAERATDLRPDMIDSWYVAARVAASGPTLLDLDEGIDLVAEGRARFPHDPALRDLEAELLTKRALRSELARDLEAARSALDELLADDPTSLRAGTLTDVLDGAH